MTDIGPSHSRLLSIFGWVGPGEKSRKRSSCARRAAELAAMVSASSSWRSLDLPEGSPIMPVPPPMSDDRAAAGALQVGQQEDLQQVADVQRRGAGIEADVGADGPGREPLLEALRREVDEPAPAELVEQGGCAHARRPGGDKSVCASLHASHARA